MTSRAPIESYVAVTQVPTLGPDTYVNERSVTSSYSDSPKAREPGLPLAEQDGRGSVFGGLLVAQAISAASATADPDFYAYTSSSSFIRPVVQTKVKYHVERVSDGRSYATRIVRASASVGNTDAVVVYVATISFQRRQESTASRALTYAELPPDLGGLKPEDIAQGSGRQQVENHRTGSLQPFTPEDEPFDWRPAAMELGDLPSSARTAGFSRSVTPLSGGCTTATNLAGLAYMSDEMLLEGTGPKSRNVAMAVTLNHHLWFHDPGARVDRWMVGERRTSSGADGRVLIHQKVWDHETGRLVMTCAQDALIRLKGPSL
ncbi:acyl-CoA thioesterase [Apiospora aurea]|uniref:Acyl-CoA thioesterase n=1 Tax=Apiospora aurea TaxID=335848 RepID=A0ABR1QPB3_9PEZI